MLTKKKPGRMLIDIPLKDQKILSSIAKDKGFNGKKKFIEYLTSQSVEAYKKKQLSLFEKSK